MSPVKNVSFRSPLLSPSSHSPLHEQFKGQELIIFLIPSPLPLPCAIRSLIFDALSVDPLVSAFPTSYAAINLCVKAVNLQVGYAVDQFGNHCIVHSFVELLHAYLFMQGQVLENLLIWALGPLKLVAEFALFSLDWL
jgi:hypothetical protein